MATINALHSVERSKGICVGEIWAQINDENGMQYRCPYISQSSEGAQAVQTEPAQIMKVKG